MGDIVTMLRQGEKEGVDGWWSTMAEAADEIERLRLQCTGLANAALANGQQLLIFEHALERIVRLEESEGAEPLDDAIMYAKKALEPIVPIQFDAK